MRALVIGTGYLGRVVKDRLEQSGNTTLHTFHKHRYFPDSVRFDIFSQHIGDVIDVTEIDAVFLATKVEDQSDSKTVVKVMERLFDDCKEKRVVYISSDAVFDGRRGRYSERDLPTPITRYGKCKALCEQLLRESVDDHCIVRTSYIYGFSFGQLDPRLSEAVETIAAGNTYARYVDMFKTPVEVNQLAEISASLMTSDYRGLLHAPGMRMGVYDFFRQSLEALKIDARLLIPVFLPAESSLECLRDTSLDGRLIETVLDIFPASPMEALRKVALETS